jgi:hypothetical protein
MRELWVRAAANGELLMLGSVHVIAGAFLLAFFGIALARGLRRWRIIRASHEAQRQLMALTAARAKGLRDRVTSEKKRRAA